MAPSSLWNSPRPPPPLWCSFRLTNQHWNKTVTNCNCRMYLFSCCWVRRLSRDVPAVAGFPHDKGVVSKDKKNEAPCRRHTYICSTPGELFWTVLRQRRVAAMSLPCLPQPLSHTTRQLHLEIPNGCEAWSLRKRDIRETRNWKFLSANRYVALAGCGVSMFVIYWHWRKRRQHRSHEHWNSSM